MYLAVNGDKTRGQGYIGLTLIYSFLTMTIFMRSTKEACSNTTILLRLILLRATVNFIISYKISTNLHWIATISCHLFRLTIIKFRPTMRVIIHYR